MAQRTRGALIREINPLIMCATLIGVCYELHTEYVNKMRGKISEF